MTGRCVRMCFDQIADRAALPSKCLGTSHETAEFNSGLDRHLGGGGELQTDSNVDEVSVSQGQQSLVLIPGPTITDNGWS